MNKPLFSHYSYKQKFLAAVNNHPEERNDYWQSIVFIADTLEIYTHGKFYGIPETWQNKIEDLEVLFEQLADSSKNTLKQLDDFYKEWLQSLENSAEGLKNLVPWTDGNHNRIALPYVEDADTSAGGGESGLIIGLPNPNAESIGGVAPNGNAVLVQLNKWNVQDFGSGRYPTNINGSGERPTYNDDKPIALVEDVDKKVSWSDEYKNRIVLPYNDSERPGKGAGQVIAYANPECKEGGEVWSDSWKNLETTDSYQKKYGKVGEVSPNFYKPGAPSVVLAQMSQYNVQEYGSQTYPINLQGSKVRPTYNDNDELALIKDVQKVEAKIDEKIGDIDFSQYATKSDVEDAKKELLGDDLEETFNTLKEVQDWANEHGTEYAELLKEVNGKVDLTDFDDYKDTVYTKSEIDAKIPNEGEVGQVLTKTEDGSEWLYLYTLLTDEDLLELEPGQYWADHNNSCANKPSNVTAFALYVVKTGVNNKHLKLISGAHKAGVTNGDIYYRDVNEGTWSSWTKAPLAADKLVYKSGYESQTIEGEIKPDSVSTTTVTTNTITSTGTAKLDNVNITGSEGKVYGNALHLQAHTSMKFTTDGSSYIFNGDGVNQGVNIYTAANQIGLQGSSDNVLAPKAKITPDGFKAENGLSNEVFTRDGKYLDINDYCKKTEVDSLFEWEEID